MNENEAKVQIRSVVRFLFLRGMKAADILQEITGVYGPNVITSDVIYYWIRKFKNGETSVEDSPKPGRPPLDGIYHKIAGILETDPYCSARD